MCERRIEEKKRIKMCSVYTIKYYSAAKIIVLKFTGKSIELEKLVLIDITQTLKQIC